MKKCENSEEIRSSFSSFHHAASCDLETLFQSVSSDNGSGYFFMGDLKSGQFYVSDNMKHDFGLEDNLITNIDTAFLQRFCDCTTRTHILERIDQIIQSPQEVVDMRFRVKDVEGNSFWVRLYGAVHPKKENDDTVFISGRLQHQDAQYVYDPITSFPQEHLALMRLNQIENEGIHTDLIGFDIHGMREINNTMGRSFGDRFLKSLANALLEKLSDKLYFFRLNGMQFMAISRPTYETVDSKQLIEEIRNVIELCSKTRLISMKLTVGFSLIHYPDETLNRENILETIKTLTRYSRNENDNHYIEYSFENLLLIQKMSDMTVALSNDIADHMRNFHIVMQPMADPKTGKIIGGEILTRWKYQGQEISPDIFIPIVEKENLIVETGKWVFSEALRLYKKLIVYMPDLFLTFNVSYRQLLYGDLVEYMEQQIKAAGIEKHRIIAELTESANPKQSDQLEHFLNGCTRLGIDVALDDFGTGYSSINMLLKYPFRIVKLAKELIVESTTSAGNEKFISAIVNICQQNGKQICAEGIETEEQYNTIRKIGCDMIQGFYFYHPMDEKSLIDVMIRQNRSSDQ